MKIPGIVESNGRYYKVVSTADRDSRGKQRRKWIPLSRVSEGHSALLKAIDELTRIPEQSGIQRAVADYLKQHLPTLTPAVRKEHQRMFDKIKYEFSDFDVEDVRPRDCLEFLNLFASKAAARQSYKYRLSAFFGWCVINELCDTNPLREITVPQPVRKKTPWTDDLFADVDSRLEGMIRCYHRLEFLLWQRTTDVRLLMRKQVGEYIDFTASKTARSTGASVKLEITPDIRAVLDEAAKISKEIGVISPYVIHTSSGTAYTRSGIYSAYRRIDEDLHGEPIGLNPKAIRPYAATKAEELGYDMRLIQKRLSQVNISTTEGYIQSHKTPISGISLPAPWRKA